MRVGPWPTRATSRAYASATRRTASETRGGARQWRHRWPTILRRPRATPSVQPSRAIASPSPDLAPPAPPQPRVASCLVDGVQQIELPSPPSSVTSWEAAVDVFQHDNSSPLDGDTHSEIWSSSAPSTRIKHSSSPSKLGECIIVRLVKVSHEAKQFIQEFYVRLPKVIITCQNHYCAMGVISENLLWNLGMILLYLCFEFGVASIDKGSNRRSAYLECVSPHPHHD